MHSFTLKALNKKGSRWQFWDHFSFFSLKTVLWILVGLLILSPLQTTHRHFYKEIRSRCGGSLQAVSSGSTVFVILFLIFFYFHHCFATITKTHSYNFDLLKPHFYIVKLGFTGVYIIFLISAQNINCDYSLEPLWRGGSNECAQSMFWAKIWKISDFLFENFQFVVVKFSIYLNRLVFVMNGYFQSLRLIPLQKLWMKGFKWF